MAMSVGTWDNCHRDCGYRPHHGAGDYLPVGRGLGWLELKGGHVGPLSVSSRSPVP